MKVLLCGLLTLCALVFSNSDPPYRLPDMPAVTDKPLYLVGYSMERYHWQWRCINTTYISKENGWVRRYISVAYNTTSYALKWNDTMEVRNKSHDVILEVKASGLVKGWFHAKDWYVIRHYDDKSLLLSEEIQGIHNLTPPCSLWLTMPTKKESDIPPRTKRKFFRLCPNATFIGYDDNACNK
uniref:Putative group viii salivary lipocalin n=1 Tax=Rhipicephalus pulchellus TaxID=72859 RepID=L7MC06_RHIPC